MSSIDTESIQSGRIKGALAAAKTGLTLLRWGSLAVLILCWVLYYVPSPDPGPPPGFIPTAGDGFITTTSIDQAKTFLELANPAWQRSLINALGFAPPVTLSQDLREIIVWYGPGGASQVRYTYSYPAETDQPFTVSVWRNQVSEGDGWSIAGVTLAIAIAVWYILFLGSKAILSPVVAVTSALLVSRGRLQLRDLIGLWLAFFLANLLRVYLESPLAASGESGWLMTIGVRTEAGPVIRWPGLIIETTVFAVVAFLLIYLVRYVFAGLTAPPTD